MHLKGNRYGFECKHTDAPGSSKSMRSAIEDLNLAHLWVVYPGSEEYAIDDSITALPATEIPTLARSLQYRDET